MIRIRTGYSFRSAVGHLQEVIDRIKETGSDYAPITDTASTFGFVRWRKLCKKAELKPVYGLELAVTSSINAKKPATDHWTFIALSSIASLNRLMETASNQFRYQPLLTVEQAMAAEDVIKIIGHRSNLDDLTPAPDLFVALSPSITKGYFLKAKEKGFQFIASSDNRYTNPGDVGLYEVICGRSASTQTYAQHILNEEEWLHATKLAGEETQRVALQNAKAVAGRATADLLPGTLLSPERPETLAAMCEVGAKKLGIDLTNPVYRERIDRELGLIRDKKFEDYFYIIADICTFARERMIVGPARGSSCGSLACYLLGITTVDPIPYDLIFERFIDVNRDDLPDIDIDFSDQKRQLVFDYMATKYGSAHVARLGTVALYKPKSCLKEAAAALDIPPWEINPVTDSILERSGGDARALQALEDTLNDTAAGRSLRIKYPEIKIAARMEGHPRHHSQHAAGVILTELPVSEYVAIDSRTGATHCDKKDAEELELLKIDALGLTQLSIFEDCLEMVGLPMNYLDTLQLDDEAAFNVLNMGNFSGIFQFNGYALQSVTSSVTVVDLEDIVAITALARPGPLNTGGTNQWIKVKTGQEPLTYPHPLFEPHLKHTLGVVAYQEQVMNIGREIGGLSWGDVTALRKAMSKSLGKEYFDKFGETFKKGAMEKGIPEATVDKVWDDLCAYGSWAFNRSHAVAYGLVSYYCCWLKAHYPIEFAAATLTHTDTIDTQIKLLREMNDEGIEYLPAHIEFSTDKWTVGLVDGKKALIGPATNVKGVGPKMMQQIMSSRARGEPMPAKAEKLLTDPVTSIDDLWPIKAAIKRCMPDPTEKNILSSPQRIIDCQADKEFSRKVMVFARIAQIKPRDENEQQTVAKRGYSLNGPTASLNLRLEDDTDVIFAKVNRYDFEKLGQPIIDRGRAGKSLYAIKGEMPKGEFRMIRVEMIRYIGDMDPSHVAEDRNEKIHPNGSVEGEAANGAKVQGTGNSGLLPGVSGDADGHSSSAAEH